MYCVPCSLSQKSPTTSVRISYNLDVIELLPLIDTFINFREILTLHNDAGNAEATENSRVDRVSTEKSWPGDARWMSSHTTNTANINRLAACMHIVYIDRLVSNPTMTSPHPINFPSWSCQHLKLVRLTERPVNRATALTTTSHWKDRAKKGSKTLCACCFLSLTSQTLINVSLLYMYLSN